MVVGFAIPTLAMGRSRVRPGPGSGFLSRPTGSGAHLCLRCGYRVDWSRFCLGAECRIPASLRARRDCYPADVSRTQQRRINGDCALHHGRLPVLLLDHQRNALQRSARTCCKSREPPRQRAPRGGGSLSASHPGLERLRVVGRVQAGVLRDAEYHLQQYSCG